MQGETDDSLVGRKKASRSGTLCRLQCDQPFPPAAPEEGETAGVVGSTGAAVSGGVAAGLAVAAGAALAAGFIVGAFVGIDASPRTEQLQPANASSIASSGIKKNRFIMRISFRFFSDRMSRRGRVIRLRVKKNCGILRA